MNLTNKELQIIYKSMAAYMEHLKPNMHVEHIEEWYMLINNLNNKISTILTDKKDNP